MITIDPSSPTPPFEQLRAAFVDAMASGELAPGHRLPTVRKLAEDLGVAPGTVARAYRELEADGVVTTRGRHGTTVAGPPTAAGPPPELLAAARRYAVQAARTGTSLDEALTAVRVAFAGDRPG